jgi:hypothetical protein
MAPAQTSLRKTAAAPRVRLKAETPEEKFKRISAIVRNILLTGYPNPGRVGCPEQRSVANLAQHTGDFKEPGEQEVYRHVMHCSPCYGQYLDAKRALWAGDTENHETGHEGSKVVEPETRGGPRITFRVSV